jgi:hypothetical protein
MLSPAHHGGDLVGLLQAFHALPQLVLVAMLARAEVAAGAYPYPAQGLAAKLAASGAHLQAIIRGSIVNYYSTWWQYRYIY